MATRVLVVDGHPVVRLGLCAVLGQDEALDVVGQAAGVRAAARLAAALAPDVVVTGLGLADGEGPGVVRELRAAAPGARVLVVSRRAEAASALGALEAGAAGYLLKRREPAELRAAVRRAAAGELALDPDLVGLVLARATGRDAAPAEALTERERKVLGLVAEGATSKEIAAALGLRPKTVENHRGRLLDKLGAANSAAAVRAALAHGLLAPTPGRDGGGGDGALAHR
jgi:DNA-binding NarL/FixJ family response regulator